MISELTSLRQREIFCFSNAEFVRDSQILSINFEKFNELFLSHNILTQEFIEELLKKTQQLQCIINRELVFDATAKVAFMLHNDLEMFNHLKRQEVSFLLHIQPETLSRVLKRLARNKVIDIISGEVIILNHDELTAIFRGVAV
jgi:CRP/FNR family transcriptional regulator